ncbi:MAG: hypothetical protein Q9184_008055, partial [Pyrenodesmia sp. 2 TL-2023]
ALQQIFRRSRNVSWVTWGCRSGNPWANMAVGAGRNIVLEMEHVRLQFVDFDTSRAVNAETLASKHLQFEAADVWERRKSSQPLLWSSEPQICYANGHFVLPRIRLSKQRKMRYNSLRRSLVKIADPHKTPLVLLPCGQSYSLFEDHLQAMARTRLDPVTVHVSHAVLRSVMVASDDYLFIVMGSDDLGKPVFALSDKQSPVIHIDRSWTVPRPFGAIESRQMLVVLYEQLLVQTILSGLYSGDHLVVLDVTESMRTALVRRCGEKGVSLCTLSSTVSSRAKDITFIYGQEPKRSIRSKLPPTVSCFVNMSMTDTIAEELAACLPSRCNTFSLGSLTDERAYVKNSSFVALDSAVANLLKTAVTHVYVERYSIELDRVPLATPNEVSAQLNACKGISIVDWASGADLQVRIQPAPMLVRLSSDKTYWLVGLTGGLGLAICRWMVDRGAKYIVMTSRKPKVDPSWLEEMEALGAMVKIFSNDVTDRNAVRAAYVAIRSTMPPIAGVAQGAMVLQDALFADMELDAVERVMKPKVNGSIYLDELFHDSPLDFFIFFSSVAAISGNKGQSMYGAANTFMHALAAQRRQRGVAGSVIDIGCVMGNGYVTRELTEQQQQYLEVGNVWLSEHDFLTIFAEAILASPLGAPGTMSFLTGLKIQSGESEKVSWSKNPMFQHLMQKSTKMAAASVSKSGALPLRQQLEGAKAGEVQEIIATLQADAGREILNTALDELGMDSLVAIEVRSWFLKELSADIPIFKILKASTPNALLASAWDAFPNYLVPSPLSDEQPQIEHHHPMGKDDKPAAEMVASVNVHKEEPGRDVLASTSPLEDDTKSSASSPIPSEDMLDSGSISSVSEALSQVVNSCERTVPMSFGQSRFWFLSKYIGDRAAFNITVCITLKGDLDVERFKQAFHTVTERHESLRTSYDSAAKQPMQT